MCIETDDLFPLHRKAFDYWRELSKNEIAPLRLDFDPFAIPSVLSNVILTDVIDHGLDFRFRVFGQSILDRLNKNYTGMLLSELPNQNSRRLIWQSYRRVVETRAPIKSSLDYMGPYENINTAEELYLPFLNTDGDVHSILVAVDFDQLGNPPKLTTWLGTER